MAISASAKVPEVWTHHLLFGLGMYESYVPKERAKTEEERTKEKGRMNLIERIADAMASDDDNLDKQSELLAHGYARG